MQEFIYTTIVMSMFMLSSIFVGGFFSKSEPVQVLLIFVLCIGFPIIKRERIVFPLPIFTPPLCMSLTMTWISNVNCHSSFVFIFCQLRREVIDSSFC